MIRRSSFVIYCGSVDLRDVRPHFLRTTNDERRTTTRATEAAMAGDAKRIGERLVEQGLIKPWQLDLALQIQRTTKAFLGEILVQKGWLAEEALLGALAEQFGMAYMHIKPEDVDWAVAGQFSPASVGGHACVALRVDAKTVTAAIANPLDAWAISGLEQRAGSRNIRLVLAPIREIRDAITRAQRYAATSLLQAPPKPTSEGR